MRMLMLKKTFNETIAIKWLISYQHFLAITFEVEFNLNCKFFYRPVLKLDGLV